MKFFLLFLCFFRLYLFADSDLEKANSTYSGALQASNWQERRAGLNEALQMYMEITPSSQVYQAIADTYFELGEYPFSILFYERALKTLPENTQLLDQLQLARNKLGVTPATKLPSSYLRQFLLDPLISQSQRLEFFFWAALIALLLAVWNVWKKSLWIKRAARIMSFLAFLAGLSFIILFYFTPIEGIVVSANGLYREPSLQGPQLSSTPIQAGSKVEIIDSLHKGYWLKIRNPEGELGYLPAVSVRII